MTDSPDPDKSQTPRWRSVERASPPLGSTRLPVFAPGKPSELVRKSPISTTPGLVTLAAGSDQPVSFRETIQRNRHPLSSFFVSLLVHMMLLLVLMLLVFGISEPIPRISVLATIEAEPTLQQPSEVEPNTVKITIPEATQSPIEMQFDSIATEQVTELAENPLQVLNAVVESNQSAPSQLEAPAQIQQTMPNGGGLSGRQANARAKLAASRGGSQASEMAVEEGLRWILAHQQTDGSWRFHHHKGACNGRCPNEGTGESKNAATGLALMSLLGAGYTHRAGPYQSEIQDGLDYLLSQIRFTPHGGILADGEKRMYAQAIATIALAEAFNMTGDSGLMEPVDACRKYIVTAQHGSGSWGYNAGSRGDMTVTGWQLMALKSCQMAGFPTHRQTWQKSEAFIQSLGSSNGHFGYRTAEDGNLTTTSIALLSNMMLGMNKENVTLSMGAREIADGGPSKSNVYFDYYATQVLHHLQGRDWKIWNATMRDYLIATQVKGQGHADGSWYFADQHGQVGGRLYTTAMAVMILEVYYRYLPLYRDDALEAGLGDQENVMR